MNIILLLIILLLIFGVGPAWPAWNWSRNWGYMPVGGIGLVILVLLIILLLGRR